MGDEESGFSLRGTLQDVLGAAVDYERARSDANYWNARPSNTGTVYTPAPQPASVPPAAKIPVVVWVVGALAVGAVLFVALRK